MKTKGEIEAAISVEMSRFQSEKMGRGPKRIETLLHDGFLVIRLQDVLTPAEQQLIKSLTEGRDLLKQVRTKLIEIVRPAMEIMVEAITGVKVISLHHDISTVTGEEVVVFTLEHDPLFKEKK